MTRPCIPCGQHNVGRKFVHVLRLKLGPFICKNASKNTILVNNSDFIWDFGKLPGKFMLEDFFFLGGGGGESQVKKWPNKIAE